MSKQRICKDCSAEGRAGKPLNAPFPGPRCYRHDKAYKRVAASRAAAKRRSYIYGLTPEDYEAILEAQGGGCGWCGRKPRKGGRMLAVDHDHKCCPGKTSCGKCVRGLLCWSDNKHLQHLKDDPDLVRRGARYLESPPARMALMSRNV